MRSQHGKIRKFSRHGSAAPNLEAALNGNCYITNSPPTLWKSSKRFKPRKPQ